MEEMKHAYGVLVGKTRRDQLEDLDIDGTVILK